MFKSPEVLLYFEKAYELSKVRDNVFTENLSVTYDFQSRVVQSQICPSNVIPIHYVPFSGVSAMAPSWKTRGSRLLGAARYIYYDLRYKGFP